MLQNSKSKISKNKTEELKFVTKLIILNIDKTLKLNLWQKCLKEIRLWQNFKPNLWQNSKTQLVTKNEIVTKLKTPNSDKTKKYTNYDIIQNLKLGLNFKKIQLWQNSET